MDNSLLEHQLDRCLALADSVRTSARVRNAVIPSVDKAIWELGAFAFVASHFFSASGRHLSAFAELLSLIERLEELHAEVQGIISYPHLATEII